MVGAAQWMRRPLLWGPAAWLGLQGLLWAAHALWPSAPWALVVGFSVSFFALAAIFSLTCAGVVRQPPTRHTGVILACCLMGLSALQWRWPVAEALFTGTAGLALLILSAAVGARIGREVSQAQHLWPLVIVALGADLWSVTSPQGPTQQIIQAVQVEEASLWVQLLVFHLPVPRLGLAPLLGIGDLIFCALLVSAVRHLGLPERRLWWGLAAGFACTWAALLMWAVPLPALCFLGPLGAAALGRAARPRAAELLLAAAVPALLFGARLVLN